MKPNVPHGIFSKGTLQVIDQHCHERANHEHLFVFIVSQYDQKTLEVEPMHVLYNQLLKNKILFSLKDTLCEERCHFEINFRPLSDFHRRNKVLIMVKLYIDIFSNVKYS